MTKIITYKSKKLGFTLVEAMVAVMLVGIVGLGVFLCGLAARQQAEFDKQRIAALAAGRYFIERARHNLFPAIVPVTNVLLDDFNTPPGSDDLYATADLRLYELNGSCQRVRQIAAIDQEKFVEVEVTISWNRTGSLSSHRVSETLRTFYAPNMESP